MNRDHDGERADENNPNTLEALMARADQTRRDAAARAASIASDDPTDANDGMAELGLRDTGHGTPGPDADTVGVTLAPGLHDATRDPTVGQEIAMHTALTPAEFNAWLASDGALFMVMLPGSRSFVMKVPEAHHEFFVALLQQVRFQLGPEVQAIRMNMVTGPPADVDAGTGKATDAPGWAQPAGADLYPQRPTPANPNDRTILTDAHCPGSGHNPVPNTTENRDVTSSGIVRYPGRGLCPACGRHYRCNNDGTLRAHGKRP